MRHLSPSQTWKKNGGRVGARLRTKRSPSNQSIMHFSLSSLYSRFLLRWVFIQKLRAAFIERIARPITRIRVFGRSIVSEFVRMRFGEDVRVFPREGHRQLFTAVHQPVAFGQVRIARLVSSAWNARNSAIGRKSNRVDNE